MGDEPSATEATQSAGPAPSPLRLRVGVLLVLLWMLPFWALAPSITHLLNGLSNPPTVVTVTTTIVVVQTILGLIGLWVAGTQVKAIIKGTTKRQAIKALWSILLHGDTRDQGLVDNGPKQARPREKA